MIKQLQNNMLAGDFSSAKIIDNYEKLTKNSFVSLLSHPKKEDEKLSLSELLNKYSELRKINKDNWKLANRYFEAYIYSEKNEKTNNSGEAHSSYKTPYMSEKEIIASIGSTGRYVMERFLRERYSEKISEQHTESNITIFDTEILNLGGKFENKPNEKLNVSTILLSKEKDKDAVYIFYS